MVTSTPHSDGPPHLQVAPAVFPDDFDPTAVPRYPVVVLEVAAANITSSSDDTYTVRLNGQPITIPGEDGADADLDEVFAAAVTAAARFIAQRGWSAARVNAVGPDGQRWPIIIGARGERYDLTTAPATPRRPSWFFPTVGALVAAAVAVAAVGIAVQPSATPPSTAPPSIAAPTAQPAELPVLPPAGYTTHARWSHGPLAEAQSLALGPTGVLTRSQDQLTLLDPDTGQPTWSTKIEGSTAGPWALPVDGVPAAVTVANNTLIWRPWDALDQPRTVTLQENTTTTVFPGGLLLTLPDQHAQLLTATGTTARIIPAGATAVGIDQGTLWASNGRQLWRLTDDGPQTPAPLRLSPPVAGAQPAAGTPVWKAGRLLTLWKTADADNQAGRTYAALHDGTGKLIKAFAVTDTTLSQDSTGSPRYTLLSNRYVIDHSAARLITLPESWQTTAVLDDQIFGTIGERGARYTLTTSALVTSDTTADATPVGLTGSDALVVASLSTGPTLYRLPAA